MVMDVHEPDELENEPITFVNTFDVQGSPEEFERVFSKISKFMSERPGFIQYRLSRHIDEDKQNRYVNIALWRDVESWQRAVNHPDFQPHAKEIRARSTNEGHLYAPRQAYAVK
ncbi:antibiotic biosynthesis monooxygenase family protein [Amycolatopsis sp. cmx-11-12]|uniref:antibiotic biosynthesis monooxygenase family protein n=1 Tax=Amycolatopsis sp. cmx-11-12 TaxID=2785795 RepID=UPI0039181A13